eukprot:TRINITY_DN422_c6_g1_i1.p1 TRINITY_DN422_c6_g1~~TRINITY_DN422_c6_g1_i1.p1  ORF type:complete len:714 (+),score=75.66 TRINITY_DN422_c6_g1_i1:9369-11510(+)
MIQIYSIYQLGYALGACMYKIEAANLYTQNKQYNVLEVLHTTSPYYYNNIVKKTMATKGQAKPSSSSASAECVKVMIRVRPMNASETAKSIHGHQNTREIVRTLSQSITNNTKSHQSGLKMPRSHPRVLPLIRFSIQKPPNVSYTKNPPFPQSSPYQKAITVSTFHINFIGTIFAYGQTGCGKTFTMVGAGGDLKGIIPNSFAHIFDSISAHGKEKRFLLRCSYLEIYNESIHDLLEYSPDKKLELKEDPQKGIYIKGLANVIVKSVADIEQTMTKGTSNRHTAETGMNKDSSRSHCIFTIYIETAETKQDGNELLKAGKLNLVDLAGSERQAKTHAEGIRLKEASKINLSLSALGNVISALVDGKSSHVPYRDSKLTRLLQDSLGGNTKTVMIACVSPADYNYDETLSTLRYASRAKNIQNKPHINEDPKDALLRKYEEEIKDLKEMLERLAKGGMPIEQLKEMEIARKSMIEGDPTKLIEQLKEENPGIDDEKLRQLEEEKALLHKDKEKIENELKEREAQFITEKVQREKLESMLKEVEQKLLCGGSEFEERQKEQTKKYRDMQQKLKKQLQKEKKLRVEQQRKEAEMLMFEKQYKDVQEELKDKDDILQNIREKYEAALSEVKDLQREHQDEKEMLLDTIREQNQEVEFYKKVVEIMMSEGELEKIKNKATWDDESNTWSIPLFVVQNKQVMLPKLPKTQGMLSAFKIQ